MVEILQDSLQAPTALKVFHQLLVCDGFRSVMGAVQKKAE